MLYLSIFTVITCWIDPIVDFIAPVCKFQLWLNYVDQTNYYSVEQANLAATGIVTTQISALNIQDYSTLAFLQTNAPL